MRDAVKIAVGASLAVAVTVTMMLASITHMPEPVPEPEPEPEPNINATIHMSNPATSQEYCSDKIDDKLVALLLFAGSISDDQKRNVRWITPDYGWPEYVDNEVQEVLDWGAKRILLRAPFGSNQNEPLDFDMAIEAKRSGLNHLTDKFVESWKPITDSGIEVIAYIGSLKADVDFVEKEGNWTQYRQLAFESMELPLQAGMSIAFDNAGAISKESFAYKTIQEVKAMGVRAYIEPFPHKEYAHLFGENTITVNRLWENPTEERVNKDLLTGEQIVFMRDTPDGKTIKEWIVEDSRKYISEGYTPGVKIILLNQLNVTKMEFFDGIVLESCMS